MARRMILTLTLGLALSLALVAGAMANGIYAQSIIPNPVGFDTALNPENALGEPDGEFAEWEVELDNPRELIVNMSASGSGPVCVYAPLLSEPVAGHVVLLGPGFPDTIEVLAMGPLEPSNYADGGYTVSLVRLWDRMPYTETFSSLGITNSAPMGVTTPLKVDAVKLGACGSKYAFGGFLAPVDGGMLNQAKAGSAIPVRFSLGGDYGLDIFASGYPKSQAIACEAGAPVEVIDETVTASTSSLKYDPATGEYTYVWKTDKKWTGCRQLTLEFDDGQTATALFQFR